jgi:hypothetical protein
MMLLFWDADVIIIATLKQTLLANSGSDAFPIYGANKFTQLLQAQSWRRTFNAAGKEVEVICVSPGMIPDTGLSRYMEDKPDLSKIPDAKDIGTGEFIWLLVLPASTCLLRLDRFSSITILWLELAGFGTE